MYELITITIFDLINFFLLKKIRMRTLKQLQ